MANWTVGNKNLVYLLVLPRTSVRLQSTSATPGIPAGFHFLDSRSERDGGKLEQRSNPEYSSPIEWLCSHETYVSSVMADYPY